MFMANLIKNKRITPDNWQKFEPAADGGLPDLPSTGDWIVPLALWSEQREQLSQREGKNGVVLENTDDPRVLVADFDKLALIAVRFPKFTDGRGYSIARLLRRLGWKGELRAVGDVLRDQLFAMTRCGFDALELRADQDAQAVLTAFSDFTAPYQVALDDGARFGSAGTAVKPAFSTLSPW
jgi:uncharacterized protein (DUF934 family)